MRERFRSIRFNKESLSLINTCDDVIENYQAQGLRLTLRQLYYQLVTVNAIPNNPTAYKNLASLVTSARMAGRLDWDAIEDRGRQPRSVSEFNGLRELMDAAFASYRLPRWKGQANYIELWVEKEALAGVLQPLAREHHVTLMVNKGYSSASAMYASSKRILEACHATLESEAEEDEKGNIIYPPTHNFDDEQPVILYLGDHDPSGEDMVRDIHDRLVELGVNEIDVRKVALTTEQVKEYNPPPNPAKITDPRARKYIEKHGPVSWEVDALPPAELARIIRKTFGRYIHQPTMNKIKMQEEEDKKKKITKALDEMGIEE